MDDEHEARHLGLGVDDEDEVGGYPRRQVRRLVRPLVPEPPRQAPRAPFEEPPHLRT